jgi:hypothetical protein
MFAIWMRRWIVTALLVPIAGRVAQRVAGRIEARRGPTPMSRRLRDGGAALRGRRRRRRRF